MQDKIRKALELHLAAFEPKLPTIWQNRGDPQGFNANAPYQKAFLMPASNRAFRLRENVVLQSGIFQINLCYPTGIGAYEPEARAGALAAHFKGRILEADGVKVRIKGYPDIAPSVSVSPYVVPVSISYESINQ